MPKLKWMISHYLIELPNFGFQYQKEDARANEIFLNWLQKLKTFLRRWENLIK